MQTTAVILAAGQGKRLLPLTEEIPKCLLRVGPLPILIHQLHMLKRANVGRVIIVTGFKDDAVRRHLQGDFSDVEYVHNPRYATTQNIVSLAAVGPRISPFERVLQINSDVMFDESILRAMLALDERKSHSAVRFQHCGEEEMKVALRDDGTIYAMNKLIPSERARGEAFGVHLFSVPFWSALAPVLEEGSGAHTQEYFEYAIEKVSQDSALHPFDIGAARAIEIDFPEDLARARRLFSDH